MNRVGSMPEHGKEKLFGIQREKVCVNQSGTENQSNVCKQHKAKKEIMETHYPKKIKKQKGALIGEDFTNSGNPNYPSAELSEMQPIL